MAIKKPTHKPTKPKPKPKPKPAATAGSLPFKLRVRMYRQGLGDCLLLTFPGPPPSHVLLDCGSIGAKAPSAGMAPVVEQLLEDVQADGGILRAVVATHEHEDHVSGFRDYAQRLRTVTPEELWLAWTEDAGDADARKLEKYEGDLYEAVGLLGDYFARARSAAGAGPLSALGDGINALLGFYGERDPLAASGKLKPKTNAAMKAVMDWCPHRSFFSPGQQFERPWAQGARFYVLGPPRDHKYLHMLGKHGTSDLYELALGLAGDVAHAAGGLDDPAVAQSKDAEDRRPFDARFCLDAADPAVRARCGAAYDDEQAAWRRIDYDWLSVAADFALQLDNYTNNTSLVFAVELDDRVLLFPADAQLGSWLSWQELSWSVGPKKVTAADLLRRTVFYKVGHHSSHNATASEQGLELMAQEDLVAFIPLDGQVAKSKRWPMPAEKLHQRLVEKAQGRVLRSDLGWPDPPPGLAAAAWAQVQKDAPVDASNPLYVDFLLR